MNKKYIFILIVLLLLLVVNLGVYAWKEGIALPDGGSGVNTGAIAAWGYTDGGSLGKTEIQCKIDSAIQGGLFTNDSGSCFIQSRSYGTLSCRLTIWYNDGTSERYITQPSSNYSTYLSTSVTAPNDYANRLTSGQSYSSPEYGYFIAGNTRNFS